MYINKIIIEKYRAITLPIEFDFTKQSLFPIIGVNECGKTSILNALFAFDSYNDSANDRIKHLVDVGNLYNTVVEPAIIKAEIICTPESLVSVFEKLYDEQEKNEDEAELKLSEKFWIDKLIPSKFILTREILSKDKNTYKVDLGELSKYIKDSNVFGKRIMRELPYILYFDDFRDSFPDKIIINKQDAENSNTWLAIVEELFRKTNSNYSVNDLRNHDKRLRNSILSDVERKLNETLTKEWANFKLDNKENLNVKISYDVDDNSADGKLGACYLSFDIEETDRNGITRNFFIQDRSKGFFWFFNFVMKLEFNPKNSGDSGQNAIYLLDEPGSYLHAFAQQRLCKKLNAIAEENKVIYCTHSHHLLNPEVIPINTVFVANKPTFGKIEIKRVVDVALNEKNKTPLAFQTYYDALYLKPDLINFSYSKLILVEGIYDFYAYSMFIKDDKIGIMPCRGADSINIFISLCLGFDVNFVAIWDNDEKGIARREDALRFFGEELKDRFCLIPLYESKKKRRLEDLFEKIDIDMIKSNLKLSSNSTFEKVIAGLYYSNDKLGIISNISRKTKENFADVFSNISF